MGRVDQIVAHGSSLWVAWIKCIQTLCPRPELFYSLYTGNIGTVKGIMVSFLLILTNAISYPFEKLQRSFSSFVAYLPQCNPSWYYSALRSSTVSSYLSSNLSPVFCRSTLIKILTSDRDQPVLPLSVLWLSWVFLNKQLLCLSLILPLLLQQAPAEHS